MTEVRRATIQIENSEPAEVRENVPPEIVAQVVRELTGRRDVTVSIVPEGVEERLLVAVDGQLAFLGLERPDGLLQFAIHEQGPTPRPFTIGGQESDIESSYLLDLETAASVVEQWLAHGEQSSIGHWERQ